MTYSEAKNFSERKFFSMLSNNCAFWRNLILTSVPRVVAAYCADFGRNFINSIIADLKTELIHLDLPCHAKAFFDAIDLKINCRWSRRSC